MVDWFLELKVHMGVQLSRRLGEHRSLEIIVAKMLKQILLNFEKRQ